MISIIIPTSNRKDDLLELLDSIILCSKDVDFPFEVIVINNGDHFGLNGVEEIYKPLIYDFKILFEPRSGLHYARNKGFTESKGEILAYLDDDVIVNSGWLNEIISVFKDDKVALATGSNLPLFNECEVGSWFYEYWKPSKLTGNCYFWPLSVSRNDSLSQLKIDNNLVWGCNFIIRKSIVGLAGGFHPDGMPKEKIIFRGDGESYITEFSKLNKFNAIHSPHLKVWHKVNRSRTNVDYLFYRAFSEGITQGYIEKRNENKNKFLFDVPLTFLLNLYKIVRRKFMNPSLIKSELLISNGIFLGKKEFLKEYSTNSELRNWVKKYNYFD